MLNQARRRQPSSTSAVVDFVQADVRRLPSKDRTADCVVNFEVLEHLPDGKEGVLAALRSFRRVLRDYGMLITEVPLSFHTLMDFAAPPSLKEIVSKPLAVLSMPSVLLKSASKPLAVLSDPVVLLKSALLPLAVLSMPVVLLRSAKCPVAALSLPVVLLSSALRPLAVLSDPVVLLKRAARQVVWLAEVA